MPGVQLALLTAAAMEPQGGQLARQEAWTCAFSLLVLRWLCEEVPKEDLLARPPRARALRRAAARGHSRQHALAGHELSE